jgi:hypothetical protein
LLFELLGLLPSLLFGSAMAFSSDMGLDEIQARPARLKRAQRGIAFDDQGVVELDAQLLESARRQMDDQPRLIRPPGALQDLGAGNLVQTLFECGKVAGVMARRNHELVET